MEVPSEHSEVVVSVETNNENKIEPGASSKPALTPPTSEDMDRKERMSSELTELEDDDDDEEIEPDHYFEGGKIPVFKPTMDQFRSFKKFTDKIDKYGMKSGIVKVIPPKEWRDSLPALDEAVKTIKVKNPIMQEFAGQYGKYTQANIEKQRSYNLPEWRALTEEPHHQPPARRGERRRAAPNTSTRTTRTQAPKSDDASPARRGPGRPRRRGVKEEKVSSESKGEEDGAEPSESVEVPPTPQSPGKEDKKGSRRKIKKEDDDGTPTKTKGRQPRSVTSRRLNNQSETANYVDEAAFKDFDYRLPGLEEFTIERCKELEDNYWRTINYGQPMYGADMPGSLFDESCTSWNVAKLPNLLDVLGTKVPGVNTAYLYLGMWKATFAWHLEDVDLYSINYIHFGAPKQWYSISQEDARRFEAAMRNMWPNDYKNCDQFLRHKTYLISPAQLEKQFNIKVNKLIHYEGEFVITYPYGYHSGYNIGYNCAESVNFANEAWLNFGRIAKKCECESDSVWVDVNEVERKLRGEPTPEYIEETDDEDDDLDDGANNLPSPPPSVKGKPKSKAGRKRKAGKADPKDAAPPKKKKIRILLRAPREMPCTLCPNDVAFDILLKTDNGLKAHRTCAEYTPETYTKKNSDGEEIVYNVQNIDKARLELKCNYCRSKRGSVFQCSAKKCTRAFHATCAPAAGVQVDVGPMPTFDEEGTEYTYEGYDFRCRFHRPKKRNAKTVDSDSLEKDRLIFRHARKLQPKDVVQFQFLSTDQINGATVVENRPSEWTVLADVLPDGDRVEIEWKYLLALDPADSQRPKPSANAKPLPEHLKENDASLAITNRTDGVPQIGDPFQDPNSEQKWQEFNTAPEVTQKVAKVDFDKKDRTSLWYYLGKTSTEAKPQYTHDIAIQKHNAKSNFLDTVKPPPPVMMPIERRSYPASFPLKSGVTSSLPRTPLQQQHRPISLDKPYSYKPKTTPTPTSHKSPTNNLQPDSWRNPHSPVAHQPNVLYDRRQSAPQYNLQNAYNNHGQNHQFHSHQPPPYSGWKAPTTGQKSLLGGIDQYAGSNQQGHPHHHNTPPNTLQQGGSQKWQNAGSPAQHQSSTTQASASSQNSASISSMLTSATGFSKSSIPTGGFTPDWMPKLAPKPSTSQSPSQAGLGLVFPPPPSRNLPPLGTGRPSRPALQFQTPDQFKQDVNQNQGSSSLHKMEQRLKQLSSITNLQKHKQSSSPVNSTWKSTPPPLKQQPSSDSPSAGAPQAFTTPNSLEPKRPTPSPISDAQSPKRPEISPISEVGAPTPPKSNGAQNANAQADKPALPPLSAMPLGQLGQETWRYSS